MKRMLLSLTGCFLLLSSGCDSGGARKAAPGASNASARTIGVSVLTLTNPFFKTLADQITAEAARHGYAVTVASGEFDVHRQQNQVKDFIVRNVAAIVLTPCDSKAIGPAIQEANAAGIPVFTADIACLAPGARVVCHVATDNFSGGRLAGQAMIQALPQGGKIAILNHNEVESCQLRVRGFREAIGEAQRAGGPRYDIVADLPGGGVKDRGFRTAEDLLQAHPDLAGLFAINDPSALGAVAAIQKAGRSSAIRVIGFDGQPEALQAIREGAMHASPVQFPDQIGLETARAIFRYFAGEPLPSEILIPTRLLTRQDLQTDAAAR